MPDETREFALLCPHCGEENPPEFPVCWKCHRDLPGDRPAAQGTPEMEELAPAAEAVARTSLASARVPSPARRKRVALEVAVVMTVVWVPWVVSGILAVFDPRPPLRVPDALWSLVQQMGLLALLAYFAWLDGDWRRLLGLERPRVSKELVWAAAAFVAVLVTDSLAYRITLALGLESGETWRFAPEARWLMPAYFAVGALLEEVFYRAYLWRRFTELSGRPTLALLLASVLFSAAHVYPLAGSISVLFFGLTLAAFFRARPSVWPLALAHYAYNQFVAA